jgi:crotonobetainyl-CoA:carnitine CoA-transferase CaiB-like acyl-CoA transferase
VNGEPDAAPYGVFQASDRAFFIGITTDKLWIDFCRAAGLDEVAADPRFVTAGARLRHRDQLDGLLVNLFAAGPADEWIRFAQEAGVPSHLVDDYS